MPELHFPCGRKHLTLNVPACSRGEALRLADELLTADGVENGSNLAIPDGVSVMVPGE